MNILEIEYKSIAIPIEGLKGYQCYADDPTKLVFFTETEVLFCDVSGETMLVEKRLKHPNPIKIVYPKSGDVFYLIQKESPKIFSYGKTDLKSKKKIGIHKGAVVDMDLSENEACLVSSDIKRMTYVQSLATGNLLYEDKFSNRRPVVPLKSVRFLPKDEGICIISESEGTEVKYFNPKSSVEEPFSSNTSSSMSTLCQNIFRAETKEQHLFITNDTHKSWLYGDDYCRMISELPLAYKISDDGFVLVGRRADGSLLHVCYIPADVPTKLALYELPFRGDNLDEQPISYWQQWLQFSPDSKKLFYAELNRKGLWILHEWGFKK